MKKRLYLVSNAHLDTQWNWTIQDVIRDSFKNTMEENFRNIGATDSYVMNFEGAFRYKLMKEYYPELYKKLKKCVADGRWNVAGAFWDGCEVNTPSSEALMRQALIGNNFFEEEFGKRSYDVFLPDCFGFRSSVPSIASHMGLIGFSTQKLKWGVGTPIVNRDGSVTRPMPGEGVRMDLGKWEGPDGKQIYVSLDEGEYTYQYKEGDPAPNMREDYLEYMERNEKLTGLPWHSAYYGVGDYGGGVSEECARIVDKAAKDKDGPYEVILASTSKIYEDAAAAEAAGEAKLPVYRGMLNIPHGFGALTSKTISKRWNRRCEMLADAAERASVIAELETGKPYPKERLRDAWKTFLWHQFHDDLTGTSIGAAYVFSHNDYLIALNIFASELCASAEAVASVLNTDVKGHPCMVYNATANERHDCVRAEIALNSKACRVYDENCREVPSQLSADGKAVIFRADVKPVSFSVYDIRESDDCCASSLVAGRDFLENERYIVRIDENGDVSSIFDKLYKKEMLSAPVRLQLTESNSVVWPSWELHYEDTLHTPEFVKGGLSVEIAENGAALVSLRIRREYRQSVFEQTVSLASGSELVRFDNKVQWFETNSLLKSVFPLSISNPEAEFDLGLGTDRLGNSDSYPYFQYVAHRYADLTDKDGGYGVSVLNDCKYGMDKPDDSTLRLTLIHTPAGDFSPKSMQCFQDTGRNEFAFALRGHGDSRTGTAALAEDFNSPLLPFGCAKHGGKPSVSALEKTNPDVLVYAFKKEYKGDRLIIRTQETLGRDCENSVKLNYAVSAAEETNGYEDTISAVQRKDNTLSYSCGHFAPKTFALELKDKKNYVSSCTPIGMEYDVSACSRDGARGASDLAVSIPAELWEESFVSAGIPYVLGKADGKNALRCNGRKVKLPEGTKRVHLLAASLDGDKKNSLGKVCDMYENVGSWDMPAFSKYAYIKECDIAYRFTHTHEAEGDRLYNFAYLFRLTLDASDEITLPDDPSILLFAITADRNSSSCKPFAPLYDRTDNSDRKLYSLNVIGGTGSGKYPAGSSVFISPSNNDANLSFEDFDAKTVLFRRKNGYIIRMPDGDCTVSARFRDLGKNLLAGCACRASHVAKENEDVKNALENTLDAKWCGKADENGVAWLEADAGKTIDFSKWFVVHAGHRERARNITLEYELQYRSSENEPWKVADRVENNKADYTLRDVGTLRGRYFRLYVTKTVQSSVPYARIYYFALY